MSALYGNGMQPQYGPVSGGGGAQGYSASMQPQMGVQQMNPFMQAMMSGAAGAGGQGSPWAGQQQQQQQFAPMALQHAMMQQQGQQGMPMGGMGGAMSGRPGWASMMTGMHPMEMARAQQFGQPTPGSFGPGMSQPMGGMGGSFGGRPGWPAMQGATAMPPMRGVLSPGMMMPPVAMPHPSWAPPPGTQTGMSVNPFMGGGTPQAPMGGNPMAGRMGTNYQPQRSIYG